MARALPRAISEYGDRGDPRPLLPRQRRGVDPGARPRPRYSLAWQLFLVARPEEHAARTGRAPAGGAAEDTEARTGVGARKSQGAPGEEQGARRALRGTRIDGIPEAQRDERNLHSPRRAARRARDRGEGPRQGLWRAPAHRRT